MSSQLSQPGQQWLEELLRLAGCLTQVNTGQPVPIHPALADPSNCWLIVDETGLTPEQVSTLLGLEGTNLDAIQYLANATLNLGKGESAQAVYTVELAGYRSRRQAELLELAESAAAQVRQSGVEVEMQPLSAVERRLIHTILQVSEDLETFSRGQEPDRRLVIRPVEVAKGEATK